MLLLSLTAASNGVLHCHSHHGLPGLLNEFCLSEWEGMQELKGLTQSHACVAKRIKAEEAVESTQPTMAAQAIPRAPQPGRWVNRDWNAALSVQRIGESRWRPLGLCWWPDLPAQPAMGEDYHGLGYERL
ncbi:hypothetical protein QJQ45_002066 [Haematococcus lacustris]|nr:hypothetical protein QJQ45_002066 [Haematococcus lacustris]